MNIYVGNIAYSMTEEDLRTTFSEFGDVDSCKIIIDRDTGRSKGFGFVEMPNDEQAKAAIEALDSRSVEGRNLRVNEAQPRRPRGPRY